ncbi:MAG: hypothetical protein N3D84_00115 [Candidatus Woesearchaeota archaeon]|nr:hypothetical protein [Candidatus Woesearchaeota archaeon]
MQSQKIYISRYIAAFAITTLIFIIGIYLGNYFSSAKLSTLTKLEQDIKMDVMGLEIQYLLLSENPCLSVNYTKASEELYNIGTRLEFMESQLGKNDERVLELKEFYHLLELRNWLFLKKAKEECGFDYDLIIYFYSNKGDCDDCAEQGNVLGYIHNKYKDINIFSFDYNIENPAIETLKFIYNVDSVPTVIINGETYKGFKKANEIEELLKR